jgi:tripartite-type tricarboxylate transporter receptor subunit TctC
MCKKLLGRISMTTLIHRIRLHASLCARHAGLCAAGLAGLTIVGASHAQNLSDQPVRIVTPYAAGFGFDVTLRRIAPELSKLLDQPVRIENRPLAPGLDAPVQAGAVPNSVSFVFAPWTVRQFSFAPGVKVVYEPQTDFVPVLRITRPGGGPDDALARYAGFIVPAGTPAALVAQLRTATYTVLAQDSLKSWVEVTGDQVSLLDGPGYTRFLETQRAHLRPLLDNGKVAEVSLQSR